MLTVNIVTNRKGYGVVAETTLEAYQVRRVDSGYLYHDDSRPDDPGIEIHFNADGNYMHMGQHPNPDIHYEFFVMNEAGKTVNRLVL